MLDTQAESQYDPLGTDIFTAPKDLRRLSSPDDNYELVYLDPMADLLSIDPLMRPMDPEHTWEYLDRISGRAYVNPYALPEADLRGNWRLELKDSALRQLDLTRLQNRVVIFGRGILTLAG